MVELLIYIVVVLHLKLINKPNNQNSADKTAVFQFEFSEKYFNLIQCISFGVSGFAPDFGRYVKKK